MSMILNLSPLLHHKDMLILLFIGLTLQILGLIIKFGLLLRIRYIDCFCHKKVLLYFNLYDTSSRGSRESFPLALNSFLQILNCFNGVGQYDPEQQLNQQQANYQSNYNQSS